MTEPRLKEVLHVLAEATRDLAKICDRDIKTFAASWHRIANNARVLEASESVDPEDVKSLLGAIKGLFGHYPNSFMDAFIVRTDPNEDLRENEHFDSLKKRVGSAAAEIRNVMKIDPRSY